MDRFLVKQTIQSGVGVDEDASVLSKLPDISNSQATRECKVQQSEKQVISTSNQAGPEQVSKVSGRLQIPKAFNVWKQKYDWLFFNTDGKMFCFTCCEAVEKNISLPKDSRSANSRKAFVDEGFDSWKNAVIRFARHEKSSFHVAASSGLLNLNNKPSIHAQISTLKKQEMHKARIVLDKIFSTAIFLARQGLALRGDHCDENSNFLQLLKTRTEDVPELKDWLQLQGSGTKQWLHHDVVDEILQLVSQEILVRILRKIKSAELFAIIGDEASDASRKEQFSFSIRTVSKDLMIEEDFLGFYEISDTKSATLYKVIKDILIRFELDISCLRGQCYDGAANMAGDLSGLQKRMQEDEPTALYVHCRAHKVSLIVQDAMEKVTIIKNFFGVLKDAINFIRDSPKRLAQFKELLTDDTLGLMPFCPTRWLLRIKSAKRMHNETAYNACLDFFEEKRDDRESDASASAKAAGLYKAMDSFEFYFFLTIVISILERVEILNAELQKCELSISEAHDKIRIVTEHLERLRTSGFDEIWTKAVTASFALDLPEPEIPRQRKKSTRIDSASNNSHVYSSPKEYYRKIFYELNDQVIMSMRNRFECETSKLLEEFEGYATGKNSNLTAITSFYKKDFDSERLSLHRQMFLDQISLKKVKIESLQDVVNYLKVTQNLADLIPEYMKLIRLLLTIPVSSCSAERSFSAMRRLKNYLRSSMKAKRLNHVSILHVHSDLVDELLQNDADRVNIINKFICRNQLRRRTFALL